MIIFSYHHCPQFFFSIQRKHKLTIHSDQNNFVICIVTELQNRKNFVCFFFLTKVPSVILPRTHHYVVLYNQRKFNLLGRKARTFEVFCCCCLFPLKNLNFQSPVMIYNSKGHLNLCVS